MMRLMAAPLPIVFVAPHAYVHVDLARPFVAADAAVQAELEAHVAEWHDTGSREALAAACATSGAPGFGPPLPRGLVDLNRGWTARPEKDGVETLFGKPAAGAWTKARLLPEMAPALERAYRGALDDIRRAATGARGLIELHSYGDLGSTYDKLRGGRPVRRAEAAVVTATPWATSFPEGLARLLPGDLRGTPWDLERAVGDALSGLGITLGPSPYPTVGPWSVSLRFLADRWFGFLAARGLIPLSTAIRLQDLAWTDEQAPILDAIATGQSGEGDDWQGLTALAARMGEWSHAAGNLGAEFLRETGTFTAVVEVRDDLAPRADAFGAAVAAGIMGYCTSTSGAFLVKNTTGSDTMSRVPPG
jgi:hypothetical protein